METIQAFDIIMFFFMIAYGTAMSNRIELWDEERMIVRVPVCLIAMSPVVAISYYLFTVVGII